MRNPRLAVVSLALASSALSCGGAVGEAVHPEDHPVPGAGVRPPKCGGAPKQAGSLIVDLDPGARAELEAGMKKGVVVVSYDCASLRLLTACKVPTARYEYAGVSRREQVLQLKSLDELGANLPRSLGKLGASMKAGRSVELALVQVGRSSTPLAQLSHVELSGACEGATHFVHYATHGAFSLALGSAGKAGSLGEIFGADPATKGGVLEDCRKSNLAGAAPPPGCSSPLRIELLPILGDAPSARASKDKTVKKADKTEIVEAAVNPCPEGYRFTDGICTHSTAGAHLCSPKDAAECKEQCDKGSVESCLNLAMLTMDMAVSTPAYKKACDGGAFDGCGAFAYATTPQDPASRTLAAEARAGLEVARRGCDGGSGFSCDVVGEYLNSDSLPIRDVAAALEAHGRGCALGFGGACWSLAKIHFKGNPRDVVKGVELLDKACQAGSALECASLADLHESGKAWGSSERVSASPEKAFAALKRACLLDATWCERAAKSALTAGKDKEALAFAERGCGVDVEASCHLLGTLHESGRAVPHDAAKARELYTKACKAGQGWDEACKKIGFKNHD